MTADEQMANTPRFKDRSTGLIIFGALQIAMGCCCALLILFMLLVLPSVGAPTNVRMMIPALGVYALSAVLLTTLGVGSILARRWARALTLVAAWMWLVIGVMTMIIMSLWMPNISNLAAQENQVPPEATIFFQVVMLGTMGCMYVAIPGIFVFFYRSAHVKATCEFKNPKLSWTDHCPLPVLALSLLLGIGSVSMIFSLSYGGVVPFFGFLLKGVSGALAIVGITILFAYLAWATYKLKMAAWWTTLVVYLVFGISTVVTFWRISMIEFYRELAFPEEQLELIEKSGMIEAMNMPLMMGASFAVLVGYMLWVRRYFVARSATRAV
jgi:hypothetical protein